MIGDHNKNIQKTREWLSSEFEMTDLGLLYFCLEIEVWQENRRTFISQHNYARELLNTFHMSECKEVVTPMEMNVKLTLDPIPRIIDSKKYQILIGSLIYLCNTRPILVLSWVSSAGLPMNHGKHIGMLG